MDKLKKGRERKRMIQKEGGRETKRDREGGKIEKEGE